MGRLEGNVEAVVERLDAQSENLRELRAENQRDHGEVMRRLEQLTVAIGAKADNTRVNDHATRLRTLEDHRSQTVGAAAQNARDQRRAELYVASIGVIVGAIIGVLTVLAATGNL